MLLPIKLVCDTRARKNGTILHTYSIVWVLMKTVYLAKLRQKLAHYLTFYFMICLVGV